jgi:catecholate siderophore receptor
MAHIKSRKHGAARRLNCSTAVALACIALPAAVHAQQPGESAKKRAETLPQITVKGNSPENYKADTVASPKFTQPLVDTPQTISVIKKELLQQQAATTLEEALTNVPGITLQLGEGGNTSTGDTVFMRGFDTSGSIYIDGIRDLGAISRDTFNLEQIEVVKGPSGSDNGRGTSSGYINLVSKTPQLKDITSGSLIVGTADRKRATVDLNRKLDLGIPGSAFRLNFLAQDYGVPGRDVINSKRLGIAPSLAFGLGTATRTTLSYLHAEQDNIPDGGVPTYGMPGYGYGGNAPQPGTAVRPKNYYGLNGDRNEVNVDMVTAKVEHDIAPGTTIRNTTRVGRSKQDLVVTGVTGVKAALGADPATFTVTRSRAGRVQTNDIATNQTNITTEFDSGIGKHTLSAGLEFIYERQKIQSATGAVGVPEANLYAPDRYTPANMPQQNGAYTDGDTFTTALYVFDTLKLSDRWMLNGGLRWEKFKTTTESASIPRGSTTLVTNPNQKLSDTLLSWKLGAVYKPASNGSIYAGWSTSFQPPGGSNFSLSANTNNQSNASLDPQEGSNIEIGTKWDLFENRVAATAAIYRSQNKKELVSDGATPPTYSQIGKRRVDGIELGLVGMITPQLNISTGLSYMDSKIVRGAPANQGGIIVFSPKLTFSSWLTYKLPGGVTIGGGARYVDTAARSSNVTQPLTTNLWTMPDYWVADAMASYEVNKNLSLQLNINNVFNKKYIARINSGGSRYQPGVERNALLTANLKF